MEKYCLSNGIVILVDERKEDLSTTCVFQFLTGSANENSVSGVAHFVEHILFAGTSSKTKAEIKNEFQNLGCYYNASTSLLKTKFYIKTINEYFVSAFKLIADIICNPLFDKNMIDIERKVIKDEILKNSENIVNYEVEKFRCDLLVNTKSNRLVLGWMEDIDKIRREDLINYYQTNFLANNLVVSFSGNISMAEAINLVSSNINLKDKPYTQLQVDTLKSNVVTRVVPTQSNQATICIFMHGLSSKQKYYEAYQMLVAILGGNTNSRLFKVLRDELGLVYHIQSFTENYIQFGLWGITFSCKIEDVHRAVKAVIKVLKQSMSSNSFSLEEINLAKKEYKVSLITGLETTSSRANFMATQYWNGKDLQSLYDPISRMEQVSKADLDNVIKTVLRLDRISLLVVGGDFKENDFLYVNG